MRIKKFLLNYVKYSKIEMLLKYKSLIIKKHIYKKKYRKINLQINRRDKDNMNQELLELAKK